MAIPRIPKLHHFLNGVCKLKYITAREQGIILRVSRGGDWDLSSTFLIYTTSTSLHLLTTFTKRKTVTRFFSLPSDILPASFSFLGSMPIRPQPYPF